MSFYSRYNGFRGFGGTTTFDAMLAAMAVVQGIEAKIAAAKANVEAASGPIAAAAAGVKAAADRVTAAKEQVATLTKIADPEWWESKAPFGKIQNNPPEAVSAIWYKYLPGFEQDADLRDRGYNPADDIVKAAASVTNSAVLSAEANYWVWESPNALIEADLSLANEAEFNAVGAKRAADAAKKEAEGAKKDAEGDLSAIEKTLAPAKAALVKAQDAQINATKKENDAITAGNKIAAEIAKDAASAPPGSRPGSGSGGSSGSSSKEKDGINPMYLAGGAVALLGLLLIMTKKRSAPAAVGRRRSRR